MPSKKSEAGKAPRERTVPRLREKYNRDILPEMKEKFGYRNDLAVPRLSKIVVSVGLGRVNKDEKAVEEILATLSTIVGQKPKTTRALKSIAGFSLREGDLVGAFVTLRGDRMWEFLDRLVTFTLPRVRDFRGLPFSGLDRDGNYNFGLREQGVFPEIDYNKINHVFGMNICLVTTRKEPEPAKFLLTSLGMPLKEETDG